MDNINDIKPNEELLDKVAVAVKNWVAIDDKLRDMNKIAKDLRSSKKQLEENILLFMEKYEHETIDITDGKLKKSVSHTPKPIKEDLILNTLTEYIKDPAQAQIITELIKTKRGTIERINLKRLSDRKPGINSRKT